MPLRPDRTIVTIAEPGQSSPRAAVRLRAPRRFAHDLSGRVLAEDLDAAMDVPPFARAAMDGYAVVAADTAGAREDTPGDPDPGAIPFTRETLLGSTSHPARCTGIATGAPLPDGADAVVMIEQTTRDGDLVRVRAPARAGQNIGSARQRCAGRTARARRRDVLSPARLGVIAALGSAAAHACTRGRAWRSSARATRWWTPGRPLGPGQIYDVNTATLAAVVREHGGDPVRTRLCETTARPSRRAFEKALAADMVLVSGGSSVGERDYILETIEARGDVRFEGIAVKPGMPTIFGVVDGRPVFGMPGNPTSCLSNAYLLVAPLLRRIARLPPAGSTSDPRAAHEAVCFTCGTAPVLSCPPRGRRCRAGIQRDPATSRAWPEADGYFEIAADVEQVDEGTMVEVRRF